mgnify:CR=1 FL=1
MEGTTHLKLLLVKDLQLLERNDLAQPRLERLELLLDSSPQAVLAQELDVLVFVGLLDGDVCTTGHELGRLEGAKRLMLRRKVEVVDHVRDVVLAHPGEGLEHLLVDDGHVLEANRAPETRLVDGRREVNVEEAAVKDGQTDAASDELDCRRERVSAGAIGSERGCSQYARWSSLMLLFGLTCRV